MSTRTSLPSATPHRLLAKDPFMEVELRAETFVPQDLEARFPQPPQAFSQARARPVEPLPVVLTDVFRGARAGANADQEVPAGLEQAIHVPEDGGLVALRHVDYGEGADDAVKARPGKSRTAHIAHEQRRARIAPAGELHHLRRLVYAGD